MKYTVFLFNLWLFLVVFYYLDLLLICFFSADVYFLLFWGEKHKINRQFLWKMLDRYMSKYLLKFLDIYHV